MQSVGHAASGYLDLTHVLREEFELFVFFDEFFFNGSLHPPPHTVGAHSAAQLLPRLSSAFSCLAADRLALSSIGAL